MRPIDAVYIACHAGDVWMARACVASVRRWHPDVRVVLLKDSARRPFSTREIEDVWQVEARDVPAHAGIGYSKLDLLFRESDEHYLALDADIVLIGPLLDALATIDDDFVVSVQAAADDADLRHWYLDPDLVRARVDPAYALPGRVFNAGQLVATAGKLTRADFDPLLVWDAPPRPRHPDAFRGGEQGMLNYLLPKLATEGRISLRGSNFMCWPGSEGGAALDFERIARGQGYRLLVHWAGMKAPTAGGLARGDLLRNYERVYYERVPFGAARRARRALTRTLRALPKTAETWLRAARPAALDRALGRGGPPKS